MFVNIYLELLQIVNENIWKPQVVGKVQINGHPVRSEMKSEVKITGNFKLCFAFIISQLSGTI